MRASGVALWLVAATAIPSYPLVAAESTSAGLAPAEALMRVWQGVRDTTEQVILAPEDAPEPLGDEDAVRVRTVVSRVHLPWLGSRVLYLEEFLHDRPNVLRRQLLLRVEPGVAGPRRVRVFPYTFRDGQHWRLLDRSPKRAAQLRPADIQATEGCDLVFRQEGDQFRGGSTGLDCAQELPDGRLSYVDYRLVISSDVYWYRRRLLRVSDDSLQEEVVGYDWFAPNDMRLFTCRVDYSVSGKVSELRPLVRLDLHDHGGHARFTTPDNRTFDLTLHGEDWPFASDRDALLLLLEQPNDPEPVASAWKHLDARQIGLDLGWIVVQCGALVPETGEVAS